MHLQTLMLAHPNKWLWSLKSTYAGLEINGRPIISGDKQWLRATKIFVHITPFGEQEKIPKIIDFNNKVKTMDFENVFCVFFHLYCLPFQEFFLK